MEDTNINYDQMFYDKEIQVTNQNHPYPTELSVEINDFKGNPDCKIGHFGYNFYFRTNAGMKMQKYKSRKGLEKAVEQACKKQGFTVIKWIEK